MHIPDGFSPTDATQRGWLINPLGVKKDLPIWAIFFAIVPAALFFILMFMEEQVTRSRSSFLTYSTTASTTDTELSHFGRSVLIELRHHVYMFSFSLIINKNLVKGSGYHLDLNLLGLYGIIAGDFCSCLDSPCVASKSMN